MKQTTISKYLLSALLMMSSGLLPYTAQADPKGHHGEGNGRQKNYYENSHNHKHNERGKKHHEKRYYPNEVIVVQQPVLPGFNINLNFGSVRPIAVDYGMTGYSRLPPGIAKQVIVGRPFPPGIAKRRLPRHFESRLPVYDGYEWRMSGRDLVLMAIGTAVVVKVIEDVFE
uniref:Nickel/cobalt homeostasis protein RcnB n=1 Tax=Providencia stuartii TaxID=588 RepID=A0AAI9DC56_PROST|nr:hypothetical protein [Providencia stuartii]